MKIQSRFARVVKSGDEGVSLLLALIFVFLISLVVTALLPYAQAGITEATVARDVRTLQNASAGGVDGAIEQLRHDVTLGATSGGSCPNYTAPAYPDPVRAGVNVNVTVTCGLAPGTTPPASDVPPYAIVTTKGDISTSGNNTLSIDGGVYATGNIVTTGGSQTNYDVIGPVYSSAGTTCTSVTSSLNIVHCPTVSGDPAFPGIDYPSALGDTTTKITNAITALPKDPYGVCPTGANYVRFQPGYYSEIPQLDPVTCKGKTPTVYWFAPCANFPCTNTTPGVYYFDFPDSTYSNYTDSAVWNLDNNKITVISGSLNNDWQTADPGRRCTTANTVKTTSSTIDGSTVGSQIIIGGPTQLITGNNSEIELCASQTSGTSPQRISLYGVSQSDSYGVGAGSGARGVVTTPEIAPQTAADTPGDSKWSTKNGARTIGDLSSASATFTDNQTFGVDLSDYRATTDPVGTPVVPDGSLVTSASIHIAHSETAVTGAIKAQVTITYTDGSTDVCPVPAANDTTIDLFGSSCTGTLKGADHRWRLLHNPNNPASTQFAKVTYEAIGSKAAGNNATGSATVDGVQLSFGYVAPTWDAERCQKGDKGTCYAYANSLSTATANTFFIGTVYTPDEPLNVVVHNNPETIFQRGVIVGSLTVTANASSKQTDSPFELPHSSTVDRTVLFTATQTGSGKILLQARVHYIDCTPTATCVSAPDADGTQLFPGREVHVLEWTVFH